MLGHLHFNIYRETFVLFYLIFYVYANASITGFHKGIKWKSSFIKDTHYISTILYFIFYRIWCLCLLEESLIMAHSLVSIVGTINGTVMVLIPKYRKIRDPTLFAFNFNVFKPMYKIKYITYCFQCSFSNCWK